MRQFILIIIFVILGALGISHWGETMNSKKLELEARIKYECSLKRELISIEGKRDLKEHITSGIFSSAGASSTEPYYYFYSKEGEIIKLNKVKYSSVSIIEGDEIYYTKCNEYGQSWADEYSIYTFNVPKGTLEHYIKINLEDF